MIFSAIARKLKFFVKIIYLLIHIMH